MNYFYIISRDDEYSNQICHKIINVLSKHDYVLDKELASDIFVIGGDGTFLKAIHEFVDRIDKVKFVGIHTGTLGFISDCEVHELDMMIEEFLLKNQKIFTYPLIEVSFNDKKIYAFNELRIENNIRTLIIDICINDSFFETFRGSGLCLSSQIGSTAYNRSIGGAVIEHGLNLLQLSEIAGIQHKAYQSLNSSIILKETSVISFKSDDLDGAILCYDHLHCTLDGINEIVCCNSDKIVKIARFSHYNYLKRLKNLF